MKKISYSLSKPELKFFEDIKAWLNRGVETLPAADAVKLLEIIDKQEKRLRLQGLELTQWRDSCNLANEERERFQRVLLYKGESK